MAENETNGQADDALEGKPASSGMESDAQNEVETLRQRFEFLEKASEMLAGSLDFKTTLANVARLAVPHIGDWCAVDLCGGDFCDDINSVQRLTVEHVDPSKIELAYELERRYPSDPDAPGGLRSVLRSGKAEFVPLIPDELLTAAAKDEEHLQLIRKLGLVSYMIHPLIARGRTLGAISLVAAESGREYDQEDFALAEDLARRAAQAIDNAILYQSVQQTEARLREQLDFNNAIMASLGEGVCAVDHDGLITYMNPTAERLLGWSFEEIRGRDMHDTIHYRKMDGSHFPAEESPLLNVMKAGMPYSSSDDIFLRKDGSILPVEYTSSPIVSDSRITGAALAFHDITERKRQRNELIAQREWFRITLGSIGDAVIATDTTGIVTFLNEVAQTLTGWSAADAIGRPLIDIFNIINEETGEAALNPVEKVIESGMVVGLANHTVLISKDGGEIPIDDSAAPIRNAGGEMIGVILVFHDITERKRAEDAMKRANQRMTRILESIGDAFIALDRDWRFTYVNRKAVQILTNGESKQADLLGKVIWGEFPDLIWTDLYEHYHRALREQAPISFEYQDASGSWFGAHAYPTFDGLSVFFQNITDRKKGEEERLLLLQGAQESERRFREIVDLMAGIFWEADARTLRFSFVSDRAESILGYPIEKWLASPDFWTSIIHEQDREAVMSACQTAVATGAEQNFEYRAIAVDGHSVSLRTVIYADRNPKGVSMLRGVMADISNLPPETNSSPVDTGE
jgi:PAS domain S-box-containing protein